MTGGCGIKGEFPISCLIFGVLRFFWGVGKEIKLKYEDPPPPQGRASGGKCGLKDEFPVSCLIFGVPGYFGL